jgi:glycosyltransferase involved in cell wall biosynthesis
MLKEKMKILTIIIPVLNEEEVLNSLINTLNYIIAQIKIQTEIIFVDDGSTDKTFDNLKKISKKTTLVESERYSFLVILEKIMQFLLV